MKRQRKVQNGSNRTDNRYRRLIGLIFLVLLLLPAAITRPATTWTGLGGANDDWSFGANWTGLLAPLPTDFVTFNAADSGNVNVVNTDFTIAGLQYTGNSTHTTNFAGTSHLQVNGPVYVGYGGATSGAAVTWTGTGSAQIGTASSPQALYVALNTSGGTNTSSFLMDGPEAFINGGLGIGYRSGGILAGNADGSLILGSNSKLHVGSAGNLADLHIGYSSSIYSGTATGLFEALQGQADLHLDELNVGWNHSSGGSATGTLTTGDGSAVRATTVNVSRGPATTGTVNMTNGLFSANTINMGAGGDFNFTGGRLAVNTFNTYGGVGTLLQEGGTLARGSR